MLNISSVRKNSKTLQALRVLGCIWRYAGEDYILGYKYILGSPRHQLLLKTLELCNREDCSIKPKAPRPRLGERRELLKDLITADLLTQSR